MARYMRAFRRFVACLGPGYLVAVGYMDPGNWVAGLAAGSLFGYQLLCVIMISNFMAMCLQYSALKLGIVTGYDLATLCRREYSWWTARILWILAELAMIATDLAEVIGSALGLQLLFGIPLLIGVLITGCDVMALLALTSGSRAWLQAIVSAMIALIVCCFAGIMYLVQPNWILVMWGCIPTTAVLTDADMLYIAIGILGATVMPHNLYLHSGLVVDREQGQNGIAQRIAYTTGDMIIALTIACAINAALIIVAAAVFYERGIGHIADIAQAYELFTPLMNTRWASFLFAIALLAAGQNSTITGTLAGQMVMEGFIQVSWAPWKRRLVGRLLAIMPALILLPLYGSGSLSGLLMASQIMLSFQLPFAIIPLILMTSSTRLMGKFAHGICMKILSWLIALVIIALNILLLMTVPVSG